ncbi:NB-ARC domain-containing protein [Reticulomyxa filosa]|uniref:NB-ARC domain-containing protein n=1 Tax=Reticulomyxa filosa TaxID=46433 RepID=X6MD29_RETFI|nr:NB-ARC domain-containing protein [Reticulomyxa filosa]|eukprot:ETO10930.1 NB-ARC domain-containing protein [Reticulomyxa filosa]
MQSELKTAKYEAKMKTLIRLYGDVIKEEELRKQLVQNDGNMSVVIEQITNSLMNRNVAEQIEHKNTAMEVEQKSEELQKEDEKAEIGHIDPGINLQGYCTNQDCLASKAKFPVWVSLGFVNISFHADKTSYCCPDCRQSTVTSIVKAMLFNSEHSISSSNNLTSVKDNHYQCFYPIKSGLSYQLKAEQIRQHATSLEDLITRSKKAMMSNEIINLVSELQKYLITVVKPPNVKDSMRLLEKIQHDYKGDYNQVFDVGRFTILCDNKIKLQTAVTVMKKAEQFNLIVSEDKNFFERQSKTHHRFHNIKLYVPKHDVYVEMQATLKNYTTLAAYTSIENPKLSHLFYEHIRAWKPNNPEEEDLKQASDETLTKINDVICEWIDDKGIQKLVGRYKSHLDIGILKAPQLVKKSELEVNSIVSLKIAQFVYEQLCNFTPEKVKGKAIYVILYEYYKRYIIGDKNPASCSDFALLLQESRKQEMEEDITISQALETYIPLQANRYPHIDGDDNEKNDTFDGYQHVIEFLEKGKEEEKKNENKIMAIQGKSGSGKSIFCRHLEEMLWNNYTLDSKKEMPVYIFFPKVYNKNNEKDIILQTLQSKNINKEIMNAICEKISFVFIMDGFDEIFDKYSKNNKNNNVKYFYNRFNLINGMQNHVLNDEDINTNLIGTNRNNTSMIYLWPFTKQQMHYYIEKFAKIKSKNNNNSNDDWTARKYEETLNNYRNLQKMIEEPFLLQLILTVLPSLVKQYDIGSRISKAQVYEVFTNQWIDIHCQNIISKLAELRIQMNINKIKFTLKQYCLDLGFEIFYEGNQVIVESEFENNEEEIVSKLGPEIENENKKDIENILMENKRDIWAKYFDGDNIAKYVLRRVGNNRYQFLHKLCQEYYAAQKIIFDIISWKPNIIGNITNQQFQQQFEVDIAKLSINFKLLNEELEIIQFIAERIHDTNSIYTNLKSRLFRIIEASKNNENVSIAAANAITILNSANINMNYRNWNNIKIPHAILDHAFFEGTNFTNANLSNVSFYQTCLNKVNFTNALMNNIYFGEFAYFGEEGKNVKGVRFSEDGLTLISWSNEKYIRIWDILSSRQIQLLEGHKRPVTAAYFFSDESKIVSCSADSTIRIWNIESGEQIQILEGHTASIETIQLLPDDSKIVSASKDSTIRLWDIFSGKQIYIIELYSECAKVIQLLPDGSKFAACLTNTIQIHNTLSGEKLHILKGHLEKIDGMQITSDGTKVISCSWDRTIRIWDVLSGQQIQMLEGAHTQNIVGIQLSPDESKLLSYSWDTIIRIWDLLNEKPIQILQGHTWHITAARFSPDGSRIVSSSNDSTIRIWDVLSGKQLQIIEGYSDQVTSLEFFPKDSKILSYSKDGIIRIWDTALERKIQLTDEHLCTIICAQFSFNGSKIVSCSRDKKIQFWDVQSGRLIQTLEMDIDHMFNVRFSFDLSKLACSYDRVIEILDASSGKKLHVLEGHLQPVNEIQFSPDNSKIVSYSSNGTIIIWDVLSGKQVQLLEGHSKYVSGVTFSSNGSKLISYSGDNTIRLWDVLSGKRLQLWNVSGDNVSISGVRISADESKIVFCTSDYMLYVCDTSSGKQLLLLKGHSPREYGMKFSPDDTKILSASIDTTMKLWDVLSGELIRVFEGYSGDVLGVQFLPDYSKIISYSSDHTIRIWDIASGQQIQLLEGHTGAIEGIQLSPDNSTMISYSRDNTIRLWGCENSKINEITESSKMKCIWRVGMQNFSLFMKNSIWKNTEGLTYQQKLLVEQRGGKF